MVLTETWLREHKEAELFIEGYTLYRSDRQRKKKRAGRDSGGVAVYLRNDCAVSCEVLSTFSNGVVEMIALYVKEKSLVIIAVYRQPDNIGGEHRSTAAEFNNMLSSLKVVLDSLPAPSPDVVICGDFNLPRADWKNNVTRSGASLEEQQMFYSMLNLSNEWFLSQKICEPTHVKGNTLDLLFVNNDDFLHSYNCEETIYSDHLIIECLINYKNSIDTHLSEEVDADKSRHPFHKLNFFSEKVNWEQIRLQLESTNWRSEFRGLNLEEVVDKFLDVCMNSVESSVPYKARHFAKQPSRIPRERKNLMRRRSRINARLCSSTLSPSMSTKLKNEARDIEKKLKKSYENDRDRQEHAAVGAIKKNPKFFFSYANKLSKVRTSIGPLLLDSGNFTSCSKKMAELLSNQYVSVFSTPHSPIGSVEEIFPDTTTHNVMELHDLTFDKEDIEDAIVELSNNAAAGPDGFPAILLKECRKELSGPLCIIWKKSINQGDVPSLFKTATVVPIHKGGSKGIAKNYRPVALTSHLIKVFEKVLRKSMVNYVDKNNLFNDKQHGFRSGRSCLSQLLSHYDNITKLLEEGKNVDVIYLDFAKAFDKVDIEITLRKLKHLGIGGKLGGWLYSFLTGRRHAVVVEGVSSDPFEVVSGVPQGSVLGPLLFLILIGDINQNTVSSTVSSFADDTRISKGIMDRNDVDLMQNDLQEIYQWAVTNNMEFNSEKFECIRYGNNKVIHESTSYYSNTGSAIEEHEVVRDLGVVMSNTGTFGTHIEKVVQTTNSLVGWILRSFKTRAAQPMLTLWKTMCLSRLDYCSQLWSPTKKGDIQNLEMVQRSFIRKIDGMRSLTYWNQLNVLKLYSLERRRERYMVIYTWKILEGLCPNFGDPNRGGISSYKNERRGRFCKVPLVKNGASAKIKTLRYSGFSIKAPQLFNSMPASIRNMESCSMEQFKRALDIFLSRVPDQPQISGYTSSRMAESNSLVHMVRLAEGSTTVHLRRLPIDA